MKKKQTKQMEQQFAGHKIIWGSKGLWSLRYRTTEGSPSSPASYPESFQGWDRKGPHRTRQNPWVGKNELWAVETGVARVRNKEPPRGTALRAAGGPWSLQLSRCASAYEDLSPAGQRVLWMEEAAHALHYLSYDRSHHLPPKYFSKKKCKHMNVSTWCS